MIAIRQFAAIYGVAVTGSLVALLSCGRPDEPEPGTGRLSTPLSEDDLRAPGPSRRPRDPHQRDHRHHGEPKDAHEVDGQDAMDAADAATGDAAADGSTGADSGSSVPVCTAAPPPGPVITDFSDAISGPSGIRFGTFPGLMGGTYTYAAPGQGTPALSLAPAGAGQVLQVATTTGVPTDFGNAWSGFGLYFDSCIDASAYAGLEFTIAGDLGSCLLFFSASFAEDSAGTSQSSPPLSTGTSTVLFSDLLGGGPDAAGNPAILDGVNWSFAAPFGGCSANFTIADVTFVTHAAVQEGGSSSADGGDGAGDTGSDAAAPACGSCWSNVAIGGGGFVSGIVFSPAQKGLAYARTDVGGFYRWEGAHSRWVPLSDAFPSSQGNDLGGESIAPDPTDPSIVYAAAGMYLNSGDGVILRSTDQGSTWTVNTIPVAMGGNAYGRGMGERLAVDPDNHAILLMGTRNDGLYESTDSAATWAPVASFPTAGDATYGLPIVIFDPRGGSAAGSSRVYVAAASRNAGSNLYVTTDGGATWSLVPGGPSGLMAHHAALGNDGTLWLAYSSDYGPNNVLGDPLAGQVWAYATATGTWTDRTPPATNWGGMAGGISVDAQDPRHVMVSTLDWYGPDRILATANGGLDWHVIAQPPATFNPQGSTYDVHGAQFWLVGGPDIGTNATNWVEAVALDPFDSNHAMYGTGAGVWSSTNIQSTTGPNGQGVTWTFLDDGLEETVPLYLMPSVSGAFLGAIGDLGGMRNTNLTVYSTTGEYSNPIDDSTSGIDFAEANTNFVVRVGHSGSAASDVAYSTDNGQTWTPCATAPPGYTTSGMMGSVAVAADGHGFVVSPLHGSGNPAYTTDHCSSWTTSSGLPSGALLASDRVVASTFYATSSGALYVSTDGGISFTVANIFTGAGAPRAVFGQAGEVWIAANGGSLYRFTGSGATRTVVTNVSSASGVGFGMAAPGQTHPATFLLGTVGGQYGFFRSDDGLGTSWTRFNDAEHQYGWLQGYIAGDESVYARAYLATTGRGYVYYEAP